MNTIEKQRKNLDIDKEAVKIIAVQAAWNGTNFKNLVEKIIEEYAESLKVKVKENQQVAA